MIRIIADTITGIPPAEGERLGIPLLPQLIMFGDETYRDDQEMRGETLLKKMKSFPAFPTTAAPPPVMYMPYFEKYIQNKDTVLVIAPSNDVSGTYRSAETAKKDFPDADIHIIDCRLLSGPHATIVLLANQWVKDGADLETILSRINGMIPRSRVYLVVDTLENLQKGGRIGGAAALLGSIFQIKPILTFKDGHLEPFEQKRTRKTALKRLINLVENECPRKPESYLNVLHSNALAEAKEMAEHLKKLTGIPDVPVYELPPTVMIHAGPGVLAVSFFVE